MKRTCSQIDMDERRKIARWRMAGSESRFCRRSSTTG
jgi:hypothetical protein